MKTAAQKLATVFTALWLLASCSTLPEDPRQWEKTSFSKPPSKEEPIPPRAKFYNYFDEKTPIIHVPNEPEPGSGGHGSTNRGGRY